jgi:hypothetical protein
MKIVINRCFGGFDLSEEAHAFIAKRKGWTHACDDWDNDYWYSEPGKPVYSSYLSRNDPDLVAAVEELGAGADGRYAELKIVNVPDGVDWYISEYDGLEEVHERHRKWH